MVGAYARAQRRKRIATAVAGLVLILGAIVLYLILKPHQEVDVGGKYPVLVQCTVCGYEDVVRVAPGTPFPITCPKCRERSCRKVWVCRVCGEHFIPHATGVELVCPACGSSSVGTAETSPDELAEEPTADQNVP